MISFKLLAHNLLGVTEKISRNLIRSSRFSFQKNKNKQTFGFQNAQQECCNHHTDMTEQLIWC